MQKKFDKIEVTTTAIKPFFPFTFNPSRRADFCVHQNTARYYYEKQIIL